MPRQRQIVTADEILDNYHTPGHPTAFAGVDKVVRYYDGRAGRDAVVRALESSDTYTRHREYKQPKYYNPYYVYSRREQAQADLIDVRELAPHNDGVKYLLLIINLFSRRVWMYPLKNKSAVATRNALQIWINSLGGGQFQIFATDSGTEFRNVHVRNLLRQHNIAQQFKSGTSKASFAERANKSLQVLLYKYLTNSQSFRYIDKLAAIVNTYNNRPHRSLDNVTPHEADKPRSERWISGVLRRLHEERRAKALKRPKFKVGDTVRIKILAKKISGDSRAYVPQFKGEYFTVVGVKTNMMVPMYKIRSQDSGDIISDSFYGEELQRVTGNVYKVERIIKSRGRGRNRQHFVKWMFFGPQHNSWIRASDVVQTYNNNN